MTKESMTTLENIHKAAKEEFLEKGFKGASLRNIVKTAGMTTGAFYGYYGSKEELFSALVGSQYDTIMGEYIKAQTDFRQLDPSEQNKHMGDISGQCMEWMVEYVYDNFDAVKLDVYKRQYEIRLKQALEEDMLCPFHYFGISELEIDGETFDDETGLKNFSKLVSDVRVEHIIEKIKYYGYSGNRVKGLIFCSTREESKILSEKFNSRGYKTLNLSGEDSQDARERAIDRLVRDDIDDRLDYIFTVDIFNEGVDIPEINQVVMLRPTKSPVVFVQQLGRGLRKSRGKDFVVILDFIGNYKNNFMIPVALSGDRSYNKDTIRRYVSSGTRIIPVSYTHLGR